MLPLLVSKLETGQRDVLQRAKEELAGLDAAAVPALAARLDRHLSEAYMVGPNQNILEVALMMEGDAGRPLFLKALDHPQEILRTTCVRGLARHGQREDYDVLLPWIDLAPHLEAAAEVALALHALDPDRFFDLVADWLTEEKRGPLLHFVAPFAPEVTDPDLARLFLERAGDQGPILEPWFLAPAAWLDMADARERLRSGLEAESGEVRMAALRSMGSLCSRVSETGAGGTGSSGFEEALVEVLQSDPALNMRKAAVGALGSLPASSEVNGWIALGLSDPDEGVRALSLALLLGRGHGRARAEALSLFEGGLGDLTLAARVTREVFQEDVGLAREARALLLRRLEELEGRSLEERSILLQVLGQIPGAASARVLLEEARTSKGEVRGLRAHRWCLLQASNGGVEAQELIVEQLARETDPLRRVDLIWALAFHRTDLAREVLASEALRTDRPDLERLYAAERLIRLGPSATVAPLLKRVPSSFRNPAARRALQCLLWRWYG
jgi:hypothetical protein